MKGRAVQATNIETGEVLHFRDINFAHVCGYPKSSIYHTLMGMYDSYYGFKWEYIEETDDKLLVTDFSLDRYFDTFSNSSRESVLNNLRLSGVISKTEAEKAYKIWRNKWTKTVTIK